MEPPSFNDLTVNSIVLDRHAVAVPFKASVYTELTRNFRVVDANQ